MTIPDARELAEAVRRFQGFYARHVAASHEPFEQGRFSLTEMRGLCEVLRAERCTAADVARNLRLDTGNLSRLLTQCERGVLVARHRSVKDRRRCLITVTRAGERALNPASEMRASGDPRARRTCPRRTRSTGRIDGTGQAAAHAP
jgi:DNA-binding MarR family transcriptional regulator